MVFEPPPTEQQPVESPAADPDHHPIRVVVTDDLQRWRLTVFFRWLLAIPLVIWLVVWSIGAFFAAIVNWFITLVRGRSPLSLHDFFASYIRFTTHLHAYFFFAADPYPSFTGKPGYPVDVEIDPPERQNRWKTLFRIVLVIPAAILAGTLVGAPGGGGNSSSYNDQSSSSNSWEYGATFASGFFVLSVLVWFASLARGRAPHGMRDLFAYGLRYAAQTWGYFFLLTDTYPNSDPAEPAADAPEEPRPVRLNVDDDLRRSRLTVFFRGPERVPLTPVARVAQVDGEQAMEVGQALLGDETHHERDAHRVGNSSCARAQLFQVFFGIVGLLDPQQVCRPPQATLGVVDTNEILDFGLEVLEDVELVGKQGGVHGTQHGRSLSWKGTTGTSIIPCPRGIFEGRIWRGHDRENPLFMGPRQRRIPDLPRRGMGCSGPR